MFVRAWSGAIIGIEAHPVVVEAHAGKGLPGLSLIGLARGAVRESLSRVRSAVASSGFNLPKANQVFNLLPAELPKEESALDLGLAVAMLALGGVLPPESLSGRRFFGELSLGGGLEPVRGAVLMADLVRRMGERELILPRANAGEAATIPGVRVVGAESLREVVAHLKGEKRLPSIAASPARLANVHPCLSEVRGQHRARRALEIAAAGSHNLLMIGPPGSGKTMLARRLPGILPDLSPEERVEVTRIHSAAGLLRDGQGLVEVRPFRAPHHTASDAALCGGGSMPRPGEITLAHRGVLFLDELPEFSRRALESMREPLEDGSIHIARTALSLIFPARVLLVAAMNPCPCGHYRGDPGLASGSAEGPPCLCAFDQIQRYRSRISGPLLDRIDLHVAVNAVPYRDFAKHGTGEPSAIVRARVTAARERQSARLGPDRTNSSMSERELRRFVPLDAAGLTLVERGIEAHGLSTRAVHRALKMARTIADLDGRDEVLPRHLEEAISLRVLDRAAILSESGGGVDGADGREECDSPAAYE